MKKVLSFILIILIINIPVVYAEDEEFSSIEELTDLDFSISDILPTNEMWDNSIDYWQQIHPAPYEMTKVKNSDALLLSDASVESFPMDIYYVFSGGGLSKITYILNTSSSDIDIDNKQCVNELVKFMQESIGAPDSTGKGVTEWERDDYIAQIGTARLKNYIGTDDLTACIILKKKENKNTKSSETKSISASESTPVSQMDSSPLPIKEGTVLLNKNGVLVTLTGKVNTMGAMMMLEVIIENNGTMPIYVNVTNSSINGWEVFGVGIADIGVGKKKKGDLMFNLSDADIIGIEQIETLEITLSVANADNWLEVFNNDPVILIPEKGASNSVEKDSSMGKSTVLSPLISILENDLEKSREETDVANIRAAYAELIANALCDHILTNDEHNGHYTLNATKKEGENILYSATIPLHQEIEGWQANGLRLDLGKTNIKGLNVGKGKKVVLIFNRNNDSLTVDVE